MKPRIIKTQAIGRGDRFPRRTFANHETRDRYGKTMAMPGPPFVRGLLVGRDPDNDAPLFINSGSELLPVEDQKHFHRQMTNSPVAIEEAMVAYQREPSAAAFVGRLG